MITWAGARATTIGGEFDGEVATYGRTVIATVWRHDSEEPVWRLEKSVLWASDVSALTERMRARVTAEMTQRLLVAGGLV